MNDVNLTSIGKSPEELQSALVQLRTDFDSHIHDGTNSRTFQTVVADSISAGVIAIKKNNFGSNVSGIWMGIVNNQMKLYLGNETDNIKWTPSTGLTLAVSTSGGITINSSFPSAFLALTSNGVEFRVGTLSSYASNATILLTSGANPYTHAGTMSFVMGSADIQIDYSNTSAHAGNFSPASGSTIDLGLSGKRWSGIYLQSSPDVSSDSRWKFDVKNVKYGLEELMQLRPVEFKRQGFKEPHLGFIAQEVRKIVPEIIGGNEENGLSIRYEEIIPILVKAVQELHQKIML